jgi:hypothetical protein
VRIVLAEQLYRAVTIMQGYPLPSRVNRSPDFRDYTFATEFAVLARPW